MKKVTVAMSGGVDSSVCASLLQEKGYDVKGAIMRLHKGAKNDIDDALRVCRHLGIPLEIYDFTNEFEREVIDRFCRDYGSNITPNPCIYCNNALKFGAFLRRALDDGCDLIATGHYARIIEENGRYTLHTACNKDKDQSYVLYGMTQFALAHTLFPLGEYESKEEIRSYAAEKGLPCAYRTDSQDICFIPDGDHAKFIESRGIVLPEGDFVDTHGNILGTHKGRLHYTLGQRRGLGIAKGERVFVVDKNASDNTVVIGSESDLMKSGIVCTSVNFSAIDALIKPLSCQVKIRYRKAASPAVISPCENGVICRFDVPQRAPVAGQAAVFYIGDTVIGGGIISQVLP